MEVHVNFDKKALKEYESIKVENKRLYEDVGKKLSELVKGLESSGRPTIGEIIPRKELSSKLQKFLNNCGLAALWRVELCDGWRMIYSVSSDGIQIIAFVLKLGDHKDYERFLNQ